MYGFNILLDSTWRPWLIEINSSPSLSTLIKSDLKLKMELIKNVFEIVVLEEWGEEYNKTGPIRVRDAVGQVYCVVWWDDGVWEEGKGAELDQEEYAQGVDMIFLF